MKSSGCASINHRTPPPSFIYTCHMWFKYAICCHWIFGATKCKLAQKIRQLRGEGNKKVYWMLLTWDNVSSFKYFLKCSQTETGKEYGVKKPTTFFAPSIKPLLKLMDDGDRHCDPVQLFTISYKPAIIQHTRYASWLLHSYNTAACTLRAQFSWISVFIKCGSVRFFGEWVTQMQMHTFATTSLPKSTDNTFPAVTCGQLRRELFNSCNLYGKNWISKMD